MFGFGKKKEPQRWGGKYAIRKRTLNDGDVYWASVSKEPLPSGGYYWNFINAHSACKDAEDEICGLWARSTAKEEILTSCEECE